MDYRQDANTEAAGVAKRLFVRSLRAWGLALALAGCASGDGIGVIMVDPSRYSAYHCNDLVTRWQALVKREQELAELMNRASTTTSGAVIGALSYRTDYETVLTEQRMVRRAAAEKSCSLEAKTRSDDVIR